MSISFSGLASGLDTSGWVDALVSVKQEKITELKADLTAIQSEKSTLTSTRSVFNELRNALEKLTDRKFGGTFDLFGKNTAKSSNEKLFEASFKLATVSTLKSCSNTLKALWPPYIFEDKHLLSPKFKATLIFDKSWVLKVTAELPIAHTPSSKI